VNQHAALKAFEGARPYRISADAFYNMVGVGAFANARVELVGGKLVEMAPSGRPHGALVARLTRIIGNAYGDAEWLHFVDTYVGIGPETVRAPDICVVDRRGDNGDELVGINVLLAIEVSHSTLKEDLERKRVHYAQAGIRHYWVVDVEGERVHCFAEPAGGDYAQVRVSEFGEALTLPNCDATIIVA
jgi:Uma2 family endonuclease